MKAFGHDVAIFDPYYGNNSVSARVHPRVQAIAVDRKNSIITANHDRRKTGGVDGY